MKSQPFRNGSLAWKHPLPLQGTLCGMAYSKNPYLPKLRARAVRFVREQHWGIRETARYFGVQPGTVSKWLAKAPLGVGTIHEIPTESSAPHTSPQAIPATVIRRIRELRLARGRCAEVIHAQLQQEAVTIHLSTVKRTLLREGLLRTRSPWKVFHRSGERPMPQNPGDLVEIDSIHFLLASSRHYIVTLLDVLSRWAFARAIPRLTAPAAVLVVARARTYLPFAFSCIQSDHGPEFSTHFSRRMAVFGIRHRHIRVRKPNDNAHVERFNRTLQDDLRTDLRRYQADIPKLNAVISRYLRYYNFNRPHLSLRCHSPAEVFPRS